MAVAEYMLENREGNSTRYVPGFISDRGYFYNPIDHTYLGWINDVRDFYVPDTIIFLTKQDVIDRALRIHAVEPYKTQDAVPNPQGIPMYDENGNPIPLREYTEEEVVSLMSGWYDGFVEKNSNPPTQQQIINNSTN